MKLESDSGPQARKWRLSRTTKRNTDYRPIELEDMKYAWAAYKQGALAGMGLAEGMTPDEFKAAFGAAILKHCHAAWTLFANTKKGFIPAGLILGAWAPGEAYLIVIGIAFMPWATPRNIIECTVGFFNRMRKEFAFMGYATKEHKRLYEVCAAHGIMRRVGTSYTAIPGKSCAVFETKSRAA